MNDLEPIGQILPQVLQDLLARARPEHDDDRKLAAASLAALDDDDIPGYGDQT
jgi:hypothetical protein